MIELNSKRHTPQRCAFCGSGAVRRAKIRLSYAVQCEETLCSGRCVGMIVVTYVLVNDPTRGYGVFIDTMLDAAA